MNKRLNGLQESDEYPGHKRDQESSFVTVKLAHADKIQQKGQTNQCSNQTKNEILENLMDVHCRPQVNDRRVSYTGPQTLISSGCSHKRVSRGFRKLREIRLFRKTSLIRPFLFLVFCTAIVHKVERFSKKCRNQKK